MTARDTPYAGKGPRRPAYLDGATGTLCLVPACYAVTGPDALMCAGDWAAVPKELRDAVWRTWRDGDGLWSLPYRLAVTQAVLAAEQAAAVTL